MSTRTIVRTGTRTANRQNVELAEVSGRYEQLSLGYKPRGDLTEEYVPDREDMKRYLGSGTENNKGFFNSKKVVPINAQTAQYLNDLLVDILTDPEASGNAGLYTGSDGEWGPITEVTRYRTDPYATLSVLDPNAKGLRTEGRRVLSYVLPGSDDAIASLKNGAAIGLVTVENPANKRSKLKLGGKGWANALKDHVNGLNSGDEKMWQHFFAQAGVYGFGDVLRANGITVYPTVISVEGITDAGEKYVQPDAFVLYAPAKQNKTGQITPFSTDEGTLVNYLRSNFHIVQQILDQHETYFKSPDDTIKGKYGAASLAARFNDKVVGGDAAKNRVERALKNNERIQFNYEDGFKTADARKNHFAYSMRYPNGQRVNGPAASIKDQGNCNIYAGFPEYSGNAGLDGEFGLNLNKSKVTRKTKNGTSTGYKCTPRAARYVDLSRKAYQAGGKYAPVDGSVADFLKGVNPEADYAGNVDAAYDKWKSEIGQNGTNPVFLGDDGSYGKWNAARGSNAKAFAGINTSAAHRDSQANQVWTTLVDGRSQYTG